MKILALDLSTGRGSMALVCPREGHDALQHCEWRNDRRTSGFFFEALDRIVGTHGPPERIVVGLGPGSYTGTRIAISAALGLHLTCGAELCGVPSVCAFSSEDEFTVIGDAKRNSFFLARVERGVLAGAIELLTADELVLRLAQSTKPVYTADVLPQFATAKSAFPRAELLCGLARERRNVVRPPLEPIYLRPPHVTMPRPRHT